MESSEIIYGGYSSTTGTVSKCVIDIYNEYDVECVIDYGNRYVSMMSAV